MENNNTNEIMDLWFYENYQNVKLGFNITKVLRDVKSPYQRVTALETISHGKLLLIDGMVMLTERNEFVYHDMICHVPLFVHPDPENVLIIGGGDGGSAREVLKHKNVKNLDMVEIDEEVVKVCKDFEFNTATEFNNKRLNLMIDDGIKYLKNQKNKYDVIIVDGSEPVGPAEGLFNEDFYKSVFNSLKEDGIMSAQTETPFYAPDIFGDYFKTIKKVFPIVMPYLAYIPDYPSGMWSFCFASKKYHPIFDYDKNKYINSKITTKYYNEEVHISSFSLPNFVKNLINK